MPPAIEFLAGSQIDEQRFKSRPNKTMTYSFPIKHLLGSNPSTSGQQWVDNMNHTTQQVAANAEESASAAEELSAQAEDMSNMVSTFQLTATGAHAKTRISNVRPITAHSYRKRESVPVVAETTDKGNGNRSLAVSRPGELIPFEESDDDLATLQNF